MTRLGVTGSSAAGRSAAGTGRAKRYPCAASQEAASRADSCPSSSTPSATTPSEKLCAALMSSRTRSALPASGEETKLRSIFSTSTGSRDSCPIEV